VRSTNPSGPRKNALWGSGPRHESRRNALWGSGKAGKRANAPWGRGGRGAVIATVAALTLVIPLAAGAHGGGSDGAGGTYVSLGLLAEAKANPSQKLHLIIQSDAGILDATTKVKGLGGDLRRQLASIGAVAVDVPAGKLAALAQNPGLTITADAPVKLSGGTSPGGYSSDQMWPYESGNAKLWGAATAAAVPTIAIVDSGIEAARADFGGGARILPQVNMSSLTPNSPADGRGHGTFVAGIAAGSAPGYAGAAPNARILPIDVMDDTGKALTSDVIAACDYILANKDALNIRVANFSLHSGARNHFYNDPLDRAVEKLWFRGVVVVAAAGNYGSAGGPSGVLYAPGNDPFVITVGAVDLGNTVGLGNDNAAPFSAYGSTDDGFAKPELGAAGRYMIGPVPATSTLAVEKAANVRAPGYIELSGTSFAAPVVAGSAAQILAVHPAWTPNQVKGALMLTAKPAPNAARGSVGVGEINVARAAGLASAPNPNAALSKFVVTSTSGALVFDSASWSEVAHANASWDNASWSDASWGTASWNTVSWSEVSWSEASWGDASWGDVSWAAASWADMSVEDAAEGDASGDPAVLDAAALAAIQADPDLALPLVTAPTAVVP
jgi:serine protease AprX